MHLRLALRCLYVALSVAGACLLPSDAQAQKVAIVDTQKIISESIIGKAAKNNLDGQIKKGQAKLAALKADFEKQKTELEKQAAILSSSALQSRQEDLEKKQMEFQRAYQDIQEKIGKLNEVELTKVVKQIGDVVRELAAEDGYDFVLERDRQTVMYASNEIDITDKVVKILDKKKVSL